MKRIFLLFSFLSLNILFGFAQSNDSLNQKDADGKKQGVWKGYYENGALRYLGQFTDNKPRGKFTFYFQTGEVQTIMEHLEGFEVAAVHYYQNGEKMAEGKYKDRKKFGNWITYGAGNSKVNEGNYIMGKKYGEWKTYYPNGQISEMATFSDDIENGPFKTFYEDGSLLQEATYIVGSMEGEAKFYFPNGKVKMKGKYVKGTKDGVWKYYTEAGEVHREIEYDLGKRITPLFEDELPGYEDSLKSHVKDELEIEDLQGKIKYEKRRK